MISLSQVGHAEVRLCYVNILYNVIRCIFLISTGISNEQCIKSSVYEVIDQVLTDNIDL